MVQTSREELWHSLEMWLPYFTWNSKDTFCLNFLILLVDCRDGNFILWFLSNIGNWIFHLLMWNGIYWVITRSNQNKNCIFQNYSQQSKFGWGSWARCDKLGGDKLTNLLRASKFWQDIIRLTPTLHTRGSHFINYRLRKDAGQHQYL